MSLLATWKWLPVNRPMESLRAFKALSHWQWLQRA